MPSLILASGSPRRRELLSQVGLALEIVPADLDETRRPGEPPVAYAERLAAEKARAVAARLGAARPVLGADTIVIDGEEAVLGKPRDEEDARWMLARLAGRVHRVATAYHLILGAERRARAVMTEVEFRPLSPGEIAGYVASREWEGKAGGYAIQGLAGAFVRRIAGSYTNVVGLPLCEVLEDLAALGALDGWKIGP